MGESPLLVLDDRASFLPKKGAKSTVLRATGVCATNIHINADLYSPNAPRKHILRESRLYTYVSRLVFDHSFKFSGISAQPMHHKSLKQKRNAMYLGVCMWCRK